MTTLAAKANLTLRYKTATKTAEILVPQYMVRIESTATK